MKALSIRQPWAWLIVNGYKLVENRSWHSSYRGPLLIHAGKGMTNYEYEDAYNLAARLDLFLPFKGDLEYGGIVGSVEMIDCVNAYGSPWFFGPYGFVFRSAKPLPFRPMRGKLGIFHVNEMEPQS